MYQKANDTSYVRFLNRLHEQVVVDWYLEVGCRYGTSAKQCRSNTVLVDPFFQIETNVITDKRQLHVFQTTSDDFFASGYLKKNDIQLSLSFLDGMHLFEYLLRDFMNTEANSSPEGVIMMHDCCPWNLRMTTRDLDNLPKKTAWTGDVWKLIPILQTYRPDLRVDVLSCKPTGLVLVSGLNPKDKVLSKKYDEIVAKYKDLTIEGFGVETFFDSFEYTSPRDLMKTNFSFLDNVRLNPETALSPSFVTP